MLKDDYSRSRFTLNTEVELFRIAIITMSQKQLTIPKGSNCKKYTRSLDHSQHPKSNRIATTCSFNHYHVSIYSVEDAPLCLCHVSQRPRLA